jgi:hypothetical protein
MLRKGFVGDFRALGGREERSKLKLLFGFSEHCFISAFVCSPYERNTASAKQQAPLPRMEISDSGSSECRKTLAVSSHSISFVAVTESSPKE